MVQKTSLIAMLVGLLVASSFVGAAAFTSATVARDVDVTVNDDTAGIITISDGTVDGAKINNGKLLINAGGDNLNRKATFTYGNNSSIAKAESTHAFKITNGDDTEHTFTLKSTIDSGTSAIKYYVAYDSDGTSGADSLTKISSGGSGDITLPSGNSAYVVVIFDTADENTDTTGTFTISA